jgi:hypothetical protein
LCAAPGSALREALEGVVSELAHRHPINSNHLERNDCSTCRALLAAKDALALELPQEEATKEEPGEPCPKCASTNTLADDTGLLCIECNTLFTPPQNK